MGKLKRKKRTEHSNKSSKRIASSHSGCERIDSISIPKLD